MKFIPMLFSTPMVQAEQAGHKTQTRRLKRLDEINKSPNEWKFLKLAVNAKGELEALFTHVLDGGILNVKCPYGKPGDVIWMRETFANLNVDFPNTDPFFVYKADLVPANDYGPVTWKPKIHMPKAACRTWLQITNIRVERLRDISEQDAIKEGIEEIEPCYYRNYRLNPEQSKKAAVHYEIAYLSFKSLWQSINGEQSWKDNPFVWVIEFKRISKPENFI